MANYLNLSIQNLDELKDYIMKQMGWPLISVEITDEQLEQAVYDAVEIFTKYVIQEEDYVVLDLENYVMDQGFQMAGNITSVYGIDGSGMGTGHDSGHLFSVSNTMIRPMMHDIAFDRHSGVGWADYVIAQQFLKLSKQMMGGGYSFIYNPRNQILQLYPDPAKTNAKGYVVALVTTIRDNDMQYGEPWIKKYALANVKEIVGTIRKKYESIGLLGGGSIDTSVKEEGTKEKENLMQELQNENPTHYFIVG